MALYQSKPNWISPEDYLVSDVKHEYIAGEVFGADFKVKADNNYFYHDVIVDCEPNQGGEIVTEPPTTTCWLS